LSAVDAANHGGVASRCAWFGGSRVRCAGAFVDSARRADDEMRSFATVLLLIGISAAGRSPAAAGAKHGAAATSAASPAAIGLSNVNGR
jgi:hypothetical protein